MSGLGFEKTRSTGVHRDQNKDESLKLPVNARHEKQEFCVF